MQRTPCRMAPHHRAEPRASTQPSHSNSAHSCPPSRCHAAKREQAFPPLEEASLTAPTAGEPASWARWPQCWRAGQELAPSPQTHVQKPCGIQPVPDRAPLAWGFLPKGPLPHRTRQLLSPPGSGWNTQVAAQVHEEARRAPGEGLQNQGIHCPQRTAPQGQTGGRRGGGAGNVSSSRKISSGSEQGAASPR